MTPIYISKNLNTGLTIELPKEFFDTLEADGTTMVLMPCKLSSGEEGYVLKPDSINLCSDKMQKVFTMLVEVMRQVSVEVLPPEMIELFFNRFATEMQDWEERAQSILSEV